MLELSLKKNVSQKHLQKKKRTEGWWGFLRLPFFCIQTVEKKGSQKWIVIREGHNIVGDWNRSEAATSGRVSLPPSLSAGSAGSLQSNRGSRLFWLTKSFLTARLLRNLCQLSLFFFVSLSIVDSQNVLCCVRFYYSFVWLLFNCHFLWFNIFIWPQCLTLF